MGNSVCVNCLEFQNEIKTLNEKIYELYALVEIKNTAINMLEQQIYILEKYR